MALQIPSASEEQIETLKDLFLKKIEKDPPPCEGGIHPKDIDRVKTSNRWVQLFLEQCDLDMKQSLKMLWDTCIWRRTYGTNELTEHNVRREYLEAGLIFPRNTDIHGKTLLIFRTKLHIKGTRDVGELIRCVVYWIERLHKQTDYDQITVVFDMQSCGLSNMDMDFTRRIIDTFKLYYPNSLNYIVIFEMAWILNAAFKIIKGLLPPKAVARMKFVNSKNMKEFITEENMLKCWGGNDEYEFKFEPEKIQMNGNHFPPLSSSMEEPDSSTVTHLSKKVHFATPSPLESPMSDNTILVGGGSDGEMLRLKPEDAIIFAKSGNDYIGTVEITNISQNHVAYKIKTTSPDKYRVRPSAGVLAANNTSNKHVITVMMQQGQDVSTLSKDKFLVMCTSIKEENPSMEYALHEIWKTTSPTSGEVEQHRLKCVLADSLKNGRLNSDLPVGREIAHEICAITSSLTQLQKITNTLDARTKSIQRFQLLVVGMFFFFAFLMIYLFREKLNGEECYNVDH